MDEEGLGLGDQRHPETCNRLLSNSSPVRTQKRKWFKKVNPCIFCMCIIIFLLIMLIVMFEFCPILRRPAAQISNNNNNNAIMNIIADAFKPATHFTLNSSEEYISKMQNCEKFANISLEFQISDYSKWLDISPLCKEKISHLRVDLFDSYNSRFILELVEKFKGTSSIIIKFTNRNKVTDTVRLDYYGNRSFLDINCTHCDAVLRGFTHKCYFPDLVQLSLVGTIRSEEAISDVSDLLECAKSLRIWKLNLASEVDTAGLFKIPLPALEVLQMNPQHEELTSPPFVSLCSMYPRLLEFSSSNWNLPIDSLLTCHQLKKLCLSIPNSSSMRLTDLSVFNKFKKLNVLCIKFYHLKTQCAQALISGWDEIRNMPSVMYANLSSTACPLIRDKLNLSFKKPGYEKIGQACECHNF